LTQLATDHGKDPATDHESDLATCAGDLAHGIIWKASDGINCKQSATSIVDPCLATSGKHQLASVVNWHQLS